ncbi:MAG TPA: penicillin acylase family protein [Mycobacteriales bacterium]
MRLTLPRFGIGLLVAAMGVTGLAACSTSNASPGPSANSVTITRDSAGIPHITAGSFTALGYGEAMAFAADNLCTFADDVVTVNGERSKYFGPTGLSLNYSAGTSNSNLDSDFFWQEVKASGLMQRQMHQPPPIGPLPQVLDLYQGFVAGYNAYLAAGDLKDPTCAGKPWVRPITLDDMFLRGYQIATEASSQQFITREVNAAPPAIEPTTGGAAYVTPAAAPEGGVDLAALHSELATSGADLQGSNGIGIGSQDTAAGDGMVLANPHFPWRGTERFWMAQLTVPGQYDVEGGTLEGFPLIGIGFNQHLAWTHTVSTSSRFTLYQLTLVPGDPTSYLVDGTPHTMTTRTVSVDTGHGTESHTFYLTQWGPLIDLPEAGYHWTTTTAYALADSTADDTFRAADQYLRMGQATSVASLLAVESHFLAIPTFNTIAADDTGHALYADVGNTPNVPQSLIDACLPQGAAQLVFSVGGVVTLDGSRSACAWADDPGTPVPGIFSAAHEPHTIRTDYVENSNDSYWLANPSAPFPAFSPIIGKTGTEQGLRTRSGNEMIAQRVAGTDGLGPPKFTVPTLQKMWESDQSLEAQLVLPALVGACRATPSAKDSHGDTVDLAAACSALAGYNGTGHLDAHGGWLFSEWSAYAPSSGFWSDAFDPAHPLTTPSHLNTANPAILRALADAVVNLQENHIPLDATYGDVQHATRNGTAIPVPGCDTGCFNAIYAADGQGGPLSAAPYGEVVDGSSLVMTTELTRSGPVSQGILTYSQATNPTSPWYANMTTLYSQGRWVNLPYTSAQLAQDRGARTVTLTLP